LSAIFPVNNSQYSITFLSSQLFSLQHVQTMTTTFFAPQLFIPDGVRNVDFYSKAFGAKVLRLLYNDDGSIHVAELSIDGALFHLHQEKPVSGQYDPVKIKGITTLIGLFVPDVHKCVEEALAAGATLVSPVQDYDYGYQQGEIRDPFGHLWLIEKAI
jgi:PhnB protein